MSVRSLVKQAVNSKRTPPSAARAVRSARARWRRTTSELRVLPDFVILGAQKAGTTSLWGYLAGHPQVIPSLPKEVHYFDEGYDGDHRTYRQAFPASARLAALRRRAGGAITGEATPFYLSSPHIPALAHAMIPDAKLIALLRNPVDRAVSAFNHNRDRTSYEPLETFDQAVERELNDLADELDRVTADPTHDFHTYSYHCYLRRGVYVDQLRWWEAEYPENRLLVLHSEDLFRDPATTFMSVLEFLELDPWLPPSFPQLNANTYQPLDPSLREQLLDWFRPHNQRLFDHLGYSFDWS